MNSIIRSALKLNNLRPLLNTCRSSATINNGFQHRQIARNLWHMCSSRNDDNRRKAELKLNKLSDVCSCGCGGKHGIHSKAEKELVEFLTEEILAERKAQKVSTIPAELDGFKAKLNGSEVTLTKQTGDETIKIRFNVNHTVDTDNEPELNPNMDNALVCDLIVSTAVSGETPESENAVNKCITELSANFTENQINSPGKHVFRSENTTPGNNDPSSFVTVIEVNGMKAAEVTASPARLIKPPKPPIKPRLRNTSSQHDDSPGRTSSIESLRSSTEQLSPLDEPFYDMVASDDAALIKSTDSSTENVFTMASTLPMPAIKHTSLLQNPDPQSPEPTSNYVNIEYFLLKKFNAEQSSSDEEETAELRRSTDDGSYASSSSLDSSTPASRRKFSQNTASIDSSKPDDEKSTMHRNILCDIIESETHYVDWLNILLQYMKAFKATFTTSQPVLSEAEFNTIFYKIPELHILHSNFLETLKRHSQNWDTKIGDSFKNMALNLNLYGAFLSNYGRAVDTVRKCSAANIQFADITKCIKRKLSGQPISLEDLLHKPVARVQKNTLVLHDLLKYTPKHHQDYNNLKEALFLTQEFLDGYNMIQTKSMFPAVDRAQRRLVKNSFIVEYVDNHRKLRHLFLFNDFIGCAKYKSSGRNEKYAFELKWSIPVEDMIILENNAPNPAETPMSTIVALKSQAATVRDQLRQEEKASEDKKLRLSRGSEKFSKKLLEIESQLVLALPNLVFRIRHRPLQKTYVFLLSSEFERSQWIETIQTLQKTSKPPAPNSNYSMFELQAWITACRNYLTPNMGSYLLRSGHDESLLVGDLHITIYDLQGLEYLANLFIWVEVDFYGHFFRKVKTKTVGDSLTPTWNETFVIDLEGSENLRILIYRDNGTKTLFGKFTQTLSRKWLSPNMIEKVAKINQCDLRIGLKFNAYEISLRRVPTGKTGALFGEKIQSVCKRQKRDIPFIVSACIREVERRGISEVGIYRVSGSNSDLQKLKKTFESNSYEAEQLLKEVDIHSVTGILKLYLRELPEALFTDALYPTLIEAFNACNGNLGRRTELLKDCFTQLPVQNKATIEYILEHLIKVNMHENENKMSLHNLATVFGPTLLRPGGGKVDIAKQRDSLATGTIDVMAQAGILYCYLQDMNSSRKDC